MTSSRPKNSTFGLTQSATRAPSGQVSGRAVADRDIGEGRLAARRDARAPEGGGKDYSRLSNLPQADRQRNRASVSLADPQW